METEKIEELGYMNIGLDINPYENDTDPVPFTQITSLGDTIIFSFTKQIAIDFQNETQKSYKAGQLKYIYANNKLTKKTE